jgi:hypothetical protein
MRDRHPSEDTLRAWCEDHQRKNTPLQRFDIRIDANGQWFHEGEPIQRDRMVAMFANILTRFDNGDYGLVTPAEWGSITVDDVPYLITKMEEDTHEGDEAVRLTTSLGDTITLDSDHPLMMRRKGGEDRPYVMIRKGLDARINRSVYYQLVEKSVETEDGQFGIWSKGVFHALMSQVADTEDKS